MGVKISANNLLANSVHGLIKMGNLLMVVSMNILQKIIKKSRAIFFKILGFICGLFGKGFVARLIASLNLKAKISIPTSGKKITFFVPNGLSLWRAKTLLSKEPDTIEWIDSFNKKDVFWDIGANVGCYTLYAGVARNIKTYAFEPSPSNFPLLAKNIELNGGGETISAFGIALSDKTQIAALNMTTTEVAGAHSSFGENRNQFGETFEAVHKHTMIGYSIDDFMKQFKCDIPNHIKIDVDGIEDLIITGAKKTLTNKKVKSVLIELNSTPNKYDKKVIAGLKEAGLSVSQKRECSDGIANYIFTRQG